MSSPTPDPHSSARRLRLWPGVLIVGVQWLVWAFLPTVAPDLTIAAVLAAPAGALLVLIWWLAFSRASAVDRLLGLVAFVGLPAATWPLLHESVATAAQGMFFPLYGSLFLTLALVGSAVATRGQGPGVRRLAMVGAILLVCVGWAMIRTGGVYGDGDWDVARRWSPTTEQRLLAEGALPPAEIAGAAAAPVTEAAWPGFRGPYRDGVVRGVRVATDWEANPPQEIWRRPVGPGWSSFAVSAALAYTQEQVGDQETVTAYSLATGEPVWRHADEARFWEAMGGAGPRATPTLRDGRLYTFGATGILNALDARDGSVLWSRNAGADAGVELPGWGFASSPVVEEGRVIVAVAGRLVAYPAEGGEPLWLGPERGVGYSSPQRVTLEGTPQVLLAHGHGLTSVDPADGSVLWEHEWTRQARIVQPAVTPDGHLLLSEGQSFGLRKLAVERTADGWSVRPVWSTIRLKPYYNDFVVHGGHAYGFDGSILACIDLETGERVWKRGRYGNGQLVLLARQDLLLVISEEGELVLVDARPDGFRERTRFPALSGKTWNHPVVVGDLLLVRNGEEMAAFRLPVPDA